MTEDQANQLLQLITSMYDQDSDTQVQMQYAITYQHAHLMVMLMIFSAVLIIGLALLAVLRPKNARS